VRRTVRLFAAVAAALALGTVTGFPGSAAPAATRPAVLHDNIVGYTYTLGYLARVAPYQGLRIRPGDTVVWTNQDPFAHDVSFSVPACAGCGPFYAHLSKGQSARLTFPRSGYYAFYCTQHPQFATMYGLVFVDPRAPL